MLAEHARLTRTLGGPGEPAARARLRELRPQVESLEAWLGLLERPRRDGGR